MSNPQHRLDALAEGIGACTRCVLHETRTNAVPGQGPAGARAMLVGEAPGEAEDRTGRPFDGMTGRRFFDPLLAGAGLAREQLFITSSVKCRPPGNRNPTLDEMAACRDAWLLSQIETVDPFVVVLMGKIALRSILGEKGPLGGYRGDFIFWQGRKVLVTYHPTAGMRFPGPARALREDMERLARELAA